MISIFFGAAAFFIFMFGKCRQWMLKANKAALTHKTRYDDTHTIYLDGRPYTGSADLHSCYK